MFLALFKKDLRCIFLNRGLLVSLVGLAILLIIIARFAFVTNIETHEIKTMCFIGTRWLVFLFAGVTLLNQSFLPETRNNAIVGLRFAGVSASSIFFAKLSANILILILLDALVVFLLAAIWGPFAFNLLAQLWLLGLAGAIGFAAVGTLLSAISVRLAGRELLLPLLLFPLVVPLLVCLVLVSQLIINEPHFTYANVLITALIVYDVVALTLAWLLFEYVT